MKNVKLTMIAILLTAVPTFASVEVVCVTTLISLVDASYSTNPKDSINIRIKELEKAGKTVEVVHLVASSAGAGFAAPAVPSLSAGVYNGVTISNLCASLKY